MPCHLTNIRQHRHISLVDNDRDVLSYGDHVVAPYFLNLFKKFSKQSPQTGLAYLGAIAEKHHKVKIIDGIAEQLSFPNILKKIRKFNSKVVVLHTTTSTFNNDSEFLKLLKKAYKAKYGFVGNHVSNTVLDSLKNTEVDFILVNEPELTFKDFKSDQQVRWCPGCGDIPIIMAVQKAMAELDHKKGREPCFCVFRSS